MYIVSVRGSGKEVLLERTMEDRPTTKDLELLLAEVEGGDMCFVDVCREENDPGFREHLMLMDELDFECVPGMEQFDGLE
jgi:hypothetical protein